MKKASRILFLIGGITAIILSIVWLVVSIINFVYGAGASIVAGLTKGTIDVELYKTIATWLQNHGFNVNSQADWVAASNQLAANGVIFLVMSIFAIPAAVLCFVARKENASLGLLITATVFNVLGGAPVGIVGGVLGIVDAAIKNKQGKTE